MENRSSGQFVLSVVGLVLLTIAIRLPLLLHPLPISDEAMYSVVANEIVDGGRLYVDAVDRKPPLLFWTYAAVFRVAGKYNWQALHFVALLWTLGTMAGLYVIGRQLFDCSTGLIAALFYSVFQPWAVWQNLAFNGELLMNLPIVWAWAIAFRKSSLDWRPELVVAGALLGAAFLLKQPAAIAAVPLGVYLLLPSYRRSRGLTTINSIIHAATLTIGFFGTLGFIAFVLLKQGVLREAFYWTITDHDLPHFYWKHGLAFTSAFVAACLPLLIGAMMAYRDVGRLWQEKRAERIAFFGLLVASAVGAVAGLRFFPHYYIQLLPALALLAAPHYAQLWTGKLRASVWILRPAVTYGWLILTVLVFAIMHLYGLASQRQTTETGRYLRAYSAAADKIFLWGQLPKIYLEAQRRPASRYILTFPLTGQVFGAPLPEIDTRSRSAPGTWDNLQQDFAKHPPAYIVDLRFHKKNAQYPVRDFPILARILDEHYEEVAQTAEGVIYRRRRVPLPD